MTLSSTYSKIDFEKTYLYSFILFAFTLPLSRAAVSFFEIFLILVWIVEWDFKNILDKIRQSSVLLVMGAFLLFQLFSISYSSDISQALLVYKDYSFWILIFILALKVKKEWVQPIITAFLYGMIISEILAYIIFFDVYPVNGREPSYPSPFMQHIDYSVFLAFTSILLLNRLFSSLYTLKEKIIMGLFFTSVTLNLFISVGRTGQLAFLIALFVATIIHFRVSIKSVILFLLLSIGIFGTAYQTLSIFEQRVNAAKLDIIKFQEGNYSSSWGMRAAFWIISYDIVKENPLIGVGIGDYRLAAQEALEKDNHGFQSNVIKWCSDNHFHNQYLMILVQTGFIGLMLMLFMFYYFFTLKIKSREIKELSILFLTIYLVSFLAEPLWLKQFPLALFVLFTGLFIASEETPYEN